MIHKKERFETIVAALNAQFKGSMTFELAGSLAHNSTSDHDADIVVHPVVPPDLHAFAQGCKSAGLNVVAIDTNSTEAFPGRPQGQDRVQVKWPDGTVIDMFFPKKAE